MNCTKIKTYARNELTISVSKKRTVSVMALIIKISFLLLAAFFVYIFSLLPQADFLPLFESYSVIYYVLFALGVLISYCMCILTTLSERKFYFCDGSKVRDFFVPFSLKTELKAVFIRTLEITLSALYLVLFLLPSVAVLFVTLTALESGGVASIIFYLACVLFTVLVFTGLYFAFVAVQKYAFLDEVMIKKPSLSVVETMRKSRQLTSGKCFEIAKLKLSFCLWVLFCVFIIPVAFVVPYYRQSFALTAKKALRHHSRKAEVQKPVVLMHLAAEPI